ncbi:MAG: acetyl-CoA carboxylase [Candidatus Limnocylindria bacterium]
MTVAETRKAALELVTALLERLRSADVRELEVREGALRVRVSKDGAPAAAPSYAPADAASAAPAAGAGQAARAPQPLAPKAVEVTAPLTGIFYRSASPQAPPFVQVGTAVGVGDVVGLIEAMKLFNEVRSTVAGRVKRVAAENGQLVRAHQALFELE